VSAADQVWRRSILPETSSIGEAIHNLNEVSIKIVLVVNKVGVLLGTISDGDIRRGLLRSLDLDSPIASIINYNALVVPPEMSRDMVMQLMVANKIHQVPIVNELHNLVGLHLWDQINTPPVRVNLMVIMAGGKGARLMPHTEHCPKPLVELAGKPMLEHIIDSASWRGLITL